MIFDVRDNKWWNEAFTCYWKAIIDDDVRFDATRSGNW